MILQQRSSEETTGGTDMGWFSQNSEVANCPRENSRMTRSQDSVLPTAWKLVRCINVKCYQMKNQNGRISTFAVFVLPRLIEILIHA
jgi:hypothetical protein